MEIVDALWVVIAAIIVLDMQAGFMCLEAGTVRVKNAANVAIKNLCDICFVSTAFWCVGFGIMYGASAGGLFGTNFFFPSFDEGANAELGPFFLFQMAFAATAATIVSGAVAERERFEGYIAISLLIGAVVYPVAGHWIWGGAWDGGEAGWLAQLGFIDFAGATVVHSVGGWAALAAIIVLGPRLGRFSKKKRRFEENSVALAALGALLLWIGWGAFNGGSALLFDQSVATIVVYTMMTAAAGGMVSVILSRLLYGHVRIELILNGVLAGLVAGTAGVHLFDAPSALAAGALGAVAMIACYELLDSLKLDDVVGAVPVHLAGGIVGTLSLPWLVPVEALAAETRLAQFRVQLVGTVAVGAWVMGTVLPLAYLLRSAGLLRAGKRSELIGLNRSENRQYNAFAELIEDMRRHAKSSTFSTRVRVERSTEAGVLALRYNEVLNRVESEISSRMEAMQKEKAMRAMAEKAFEAMRKAQQESEWAARHDSLTGLGNRKFLEEIVESPETEQKTAGGQLVIAIDLDRFKDVNDTYGHEAGDCVIAEVGRRLQDRVRDGRDFGFRIGGDEFVLLLDFEGSDTQAQWYCDQLIEDLLLPLLYRTAELRVGASIGFARAKNGEGLQEALKRADLSLYEAKSQGRSQAIAYSATFGVAHDAKIALINDFKSALENDEIKVELQPQVDAQTRSLKGIEVLARWEHPKRGRQSPAIFTGIAQELKMMGDLDRRVLDLALEARTIIKEELGYAPEMAVNVSADRLMAPDLLDELRNRTDLPEQGIAFEVLETAFLDTVSDELAQKIAAIKDMGIRIEVDDFGTGHASFASVLAIKPDRLKIDRMFVTGVDKDPAKHELMRGLVEMAGRVAADTVVEGVETMSEARALADAGAGALQGFAFSRPLSLPDFITWARNWDVKAA